MIPRFRNRRGCDKDMCGLIKKKKMHANRNNPANSIRNLQNKIYTSTCRNRMSTHVLMMQPTGVTAAVSEINCDPSCDLFWKVSSHPG